MPLVKLQLRPGVVKDVTSYTNTGGWSDGNLIRFRLGSPEQIGGWTKYALGAFPGSARALLQWSTLNFSYLIAIGTQFKLLIYSNGGFADITPLRTTRSLPAGSLITWADLSATTWAGLGSITWADLTLGALSTVAVGTNQILVNDPGHGADLYDFVTFSGATGFDGYAAGQLNANLQISQIVSANFYIVNVPGGLTVTAGVSGGGPSIVAAYEIHVGTDIQVFGTGWGAGPWGRGTWGSSSSSPVVVSQLRLWSLANFGEDLIANVRGGGIYYWTAANGLNTRAIALSSLPGAVAAPTVANQILVSPIDRHVVALGCDDEFAPGIQNPLLVRWSGTENALDWETRTDNTAGSYPLTRGSAIVGGIYGIKQILIHTNLSMYTMRFEGPPYIFGFDEITDSISKISPNASIEGRNVVYWMDNNNFYAYDGTVRALECPLRDYVFKNINLKQRFKVTCGINSLFNEVIWFYPSANSYENDRYVIYNIAEQTWAPGILSRTAWLDLSASGFPIAATRIQIGSDINNTYGVLYQHEIGYNDDGAPMNSFVESADFEIPEAGDNYAFLNRLLPDITFRGIATMPTVAYTVKTRDFPGSSFASAATVTVTPTSRQQNIRARGRQIAVRIEGNDYDLGWRLGTSRVEMKQDGAK